MAITHEPRFGAADSSTEPTGQAIRETAARTQAEAKAVATEQKAALADELHSIGRAFQKTGENLREEGKATAADLTERVGHYADQLGEALHEKRFGDLMHDLEDIARQRPMLVVGAAAVCGFALTRFFRSSSQQGDEALAAADEEPSSFEDALSEPFPSEGSPLHGEPSHGLIDPDDSRQGSLP